MSGVSTTWRFYDSNFEVLPRISLILFGSFSIGFGAAAENDFKLGVVDTQGVFENFIKAQQANDILKAAEERLRNQLNAIQQEITTMEERLTSRSCFLTLRRLRLFKLILVSKGKSSNSELEIGQESLIAKREELLAPLTQDIESLLQQIGESEGYSLILEKRLVTLYVDPKYDLTERVLKLLNDAYEKEKSKDAQQSATPPETATGKEGEKSN